MGAQGCRCHYCPGVEDTAGNAVSEEFQKGDSLQEQTLEQIAGALSSASAPKLSKEQQGRNSTPTPDNAEVGNGAPQEDFAKQVSSGDTDYDPSQSVPLSVTSDITDRRNSDGSIDPKVSANRAWRRLRTSVTVCIAFKRTLYKPLLLVAAGHAGDIMTEHEEDSKHIMPDTILKKGDPEEIANYRQIFEVEGSDSLQTVTPKFHGSTEVDVTGDGTKQMFLRISNLLVGFSQPKVMDCKLGVRTFQEDECKSKKEREDLYKKLVKLPNVEITEDERAKGKCTKFRWMTARDTCSSTRSLGFRIDGIAGPGENKKTWVDFCGYSLRQDVVRELHSFIPVELSRTKRISLASLFVNELERMKTQCEASPFFKSHEFIGSSLLLVAQTAAHLPSKGAISLIDLAKTTELSPGTSIDHRSPWVLGNHEDGVLFGLDNCISCWKEVLASLEAEGALEANGTTNGN